MDQPKQQLVQKLHDSTNVLVTVSRNPSVDQLSAAIGFTLALNALGKHATAVFSGQIPSTIEFLEPEHTIEKNTDSLRDFIISLDKEKADKLRYKVEDQMVKIFITPYRTSISDSDLVFSQGDFNVDMVVAIGVREKEELDEAIISHGRILHDAAVATLNTSTSGQLGSINWVDAEASSLCEMLGGVAQELKEGILDAQMATAFLTGIVAETERFSNEKTSSNTMKLSAVLMAAGANQQLVATKLQAPERPEPASSEPSGDSENSEQTSNNDQPEESAGNDDGVLKVDRESGPVKEHEQPPVFDEQLPKTEELRPEDSSEESDEPTEAVSQDEQAAKTRGSEYVTGSPSRTGTLTANYKMDYEETVNPLEPATQQPMLSRKEPEQDEQPEQSQDQPVLGQADPEKHEETDEERQKREQAYKQAMSAPVPDSQTLSALEEAIESPHSESESEQNTDERQTPEGPSPDKDSAREAVEEAMRSAVPSPDQPQPPNEDLNAAGVMEVDHSIQIDPATGQVQQAKDMTVSHKDHPEPEQPQPPAPSAQEPQEDESNGNDAPPFPPPMPMIPPTPPPDQNDQSSGPNLPPVNY